MPVRVTKVLGKIGDIVRHPDGRYVEIVHSGRTDFWFWREVRADGTLGTRLEYGHGRIKDRHLFLETARP